MLLVLHLRNLSFQFLSNLHKKNIEILKAQNMLLNWDNFQLLDYEIRVLSDSNVFALDNLGRLLTVNAYDRT